MTHERTIWDFWADRYEGLWAQYFSLRPSRQRVLDRVDEVGLADGFRLLDLGCGVGQFLAELADRRPDAALVGYDPAGSMIARARADHARPSVTYHTGGLGEVPDDEAPFDAITCMHAFPYVPDKPAAMARLAALLKPGGRLWIVQANTESWYDRAFLLFVKLTTTAATYHSAAQLGELVRDAGMTPGEVWRITRHVFIPSIQLVEGIR